MKTCPRLAISMIAAALLITTQGYAQQLDSKIFEGANKKTLPCRIHVPAAEAGKKYPLIMFFHGAGERGVDNQRQIVHGVNDILAYAEAQKEPVILVAPQCPNGQQWVNTPWGADSHTMPEVPSESLALAIELMQQIMATQPVDTSRIYVTGLSMGGYGTWDLMQRMPDIFAAGIPVCGGGDTAQAPRIKDIPIWAFHGGADTVVKTHRSRDMIAALKAAGGNPSYTEYEGVGHNAWTATFKNPDVLRWLFSQRKAN